MVRCKNLLLITNRHRIGQLDYANENMSSLWPLDIRFFRYDVRIEKEIFGLPSQMWSRLGKKSWKTFCFFSIFLENRHQKKVFYKNIGLISSTKNSLERFLMPFRLQNSYTKKFLPLELFSSKHCIISLVSHTCDYAPHCKWKTSNTEPKKLFVAWISSVNYPVPGISKCLSMENFPKGFLRTYGDICLFLTFLFPITIVFSFISFMIHEGKKVFRQVMAT